MPLIPGEAIAKIENMIYLPMIINVLERDRGAVEIWLIQIERTLHQTNRRCVNGREYRIKRNK